LSSILENAHPISKVSRDLRKRAGELTKAEVRFVVDLYYQVQDYRISTANQVRSATSPKEGEPVEPHGLLLWGFEAFETVENEIRKALRDYAESHRAGRWALSIHGIGPVIASGLLAHIDIEKAPTVGHIWRFAGLDPTVTWGKGQKRPWNAKLKVLCWKTGQSFMKLRNSPNDVYGRVYAERKALELARNEAGTFAETAKRTLEAKAIRDKDTRATYEAGKLPAGRLELRAERYAVKLFLSHLHHVMYESRFGEPPPKPYILTKDDHTHFLAPPLWPCE
jgi:hypothetical protein